MNEGTVSKPSRASKALGDIWEVRERCGWNVFCQVSSGFFHLITDELSLWHRPAWMFNAPETLAFDLRSFLSQRSQTPKNVWSLSTRPWSCCRQLTTRRCDTSWLTSNGLNTQLTLTHRRFRVAALTALLRIWLFSLTSDPLTRFHFHFLSSPLLEWPRTRRTTSCPVRTWASSSGRHWWGPPSWTPWRRWTTSVTRDSWWKLWLPTKTCCFEGRGGSKCIFQSGEEGQLGVGKWLACFVLLPISDS